MPHCPPLKISLAAFALTIVVPVAAQRVEMSCEPLWAGDQKQAGAILPIRVELVNRGPAIFGSVHVENEATRYPVDLPEGARKALVIYAQSRWGYTQVTFQPPLGRGTPLTVLCEQPASARSVDHLFGLVGGEPGALDFLRSESVSGTGNFGACTVDLEAAPTRLVGYQAIGTVVLGSGAERLSDRQVEALQDFVVSGGTLVLFGGASTPHLQDVRWAAWLPVHDVFPDNITARGQTFTTSRFQLAPGAEYVELREFRAGELPDAVGRGARLRAGLGKVLFIPVNLLEGPPAEWPERRGVLRTHANAADRAKALQVKDHPSPLRASTEDQFRVTLPSVGQMLLVLLVYLGVVIPVNFAVLRRLRRLEWAWVTSPLIALVFAGILLLSSRDLYGREQARSVVGAVALDLRTGRGVFTGTADLFVERAGVYDLGLENVDWIGPEQSADPEDWYRSAWDPDFLESWAPPAVDVGTILVPDLNARSLSFYRFEFIQHVTLVGLEIEVERPWFRNPAERLRARIRNGTPHDLAGVALDFGMFAYVHRDQIPSGGEAVIDVAATDIPEVTLRDWVPEHDILFRSALVLEELGPQIGRWVKDEPTVEIVAVLPGGTR